MMDDFSQKSSMSLTQENPVSAYQHLLSAAPINQLYPIDTQGSGSTEGNHKFSTDDKPVVLKHTLGRLNENSPVPIFIDNDIGCAKLGPDQNQIETEDDSDSPGSLRQVSLPDYSLEDPHRYQPHTPAFVVNPFKSRGSVMQKLELFAATQPSSINRQVSPVSSRPSPHGYDAFSSPVARKRSLLSPLIGYRTENISQISARDLLTYPDSQGNQCTDNHDSIVQPFDVYSQQSRSPLEHVSHPQFLSKEKQEKARQSNVSESEDFNSSLENLPRYQKQKIVQESFNTDIRKSLAEFRPKSHFPSVKISTQQRQILQEQYIAQCEGRELKNIQQEYVADTQISFAGENNEADSLVSNTLIPRSENESRKNTFPISSIQGNEEQEQLISSLSSNKNSQLESMPSQSVLTLKSIHVQGDTLLSLPSQNFPTNRVLVDKNRLHSANSDTVPETSPVSEQLPLLERDATETYACKINDLNDNIPDISQDLKHVETKCISRSPSLFVAQISNNTEKPVVTYPKIPKKSTTAQISTIQKLDVTPVAKQSQSSPQTSNVSDKESYSEIELLVCAAKKEGLTRMSLNTSEKTVLAEHNSQKLTRRKMCDKIGDNQAPIIAEACNSGEIPINTEPTTESPNQKIKSSTSRSRSSTSKSKRCATEKGVPARSKSLSTARSSKPTQCTPPEVNHQSTAKNLVRAGSRKSNTAKPKNQLSEKQVSNLPATKRVVKRKSLHISLSGVPIVASTRSSKRSSIDYSDDPLSASVPPDFYSPRRSGLLFKNMAFAVSYVKNEKERKAVTQSIVENGGNILEGGFDVLFESSSHTNSAVFDSEALSLSKIGKSLCFAAVIADEHSRKTKYVQALALGLPCISGRWIQSCVSKSLILDWSAYLLCAGQSSVLGNACRSRILQPYAAAEAELSATFTQRKKILEGKSVLLVTGKGKVLEKRKTFNFLTRALGPARIGHVTDISEARKSLLEAEIQGCEWDLLHVHDNEKNSASDIFNSTGKRKNIEGAIPCPKRVRIITDEIMIQSLIFGELLDE